MYFLYVFFTYILNFIHRALVLTPQKLFLIKLEHNCILTLNYAKTIFNLV